MQQPLRIEVGAVLKWNQVKCIKCSVGESPSEIQICWDWMEPEECLRKPEPWSSFFGLENRKILSVWQGHDQCSYSAIYPEQSDSEMKTGLYVGIFFFCSGIDAFPSLPDSHPSLEVCCLQNEQIISWVNDRGSHQRGLARSCLDEGVQLRGLLLSHTFLWF